MRIESGSGRPFTRGFPGASGGRPVRLALGREHLEWFWQIRWAQWRAQAGPRLRCSEAQWRARMESLYAAGFGQAMIGQAGLDDPRVRQDYWERWFKGYERWRSLPRGSYQPRRSRGASLSLLRD